MLSNIRLIGVQEEHPAHKQHL